MGTAMGAPSLVYRRARVGAVRADGVRGRPVRAGRRGRRGPRSSPRGRARVRWAPVGTRVPLVGARHGAARLSVRGGVGLRGSCGQGLRGVRRAPRAEGSFPRSPVAVGEAGRSGPDALARGIGAVGRRTGRTRDEWRVRPHARQRGRARVGARRGVTGRAGHRRGPQPADPGDDLLEAVLPPGAGMTGALTVLGVPIDSVGRSGGTELAPAKLRSLGLVEALSGHDEGDLDVRIRGDDRDPVTGIIASDDILTTSVAIRAAVSRSLSGGARPLLIGGCCTELVGALAGARDVFGRVGLAYLDGHLDLYDGETSPTGEAADMPVAVVLGRGPSVWVDAAGSVTEPGRVRLVGPRDLDEALGFG